MGKNKLREVLIADDDDDDFNILSITIQELQTDIIISRADNGEELLKILEEKIPDLLFLDIQMPCLDGKDCIMRIRKERKYDNLPIIVYSAYKESSIVDFFYLNRTNLFIYKPDSFHEVSELMKKVFMIDWKSKRHYPEKSAFVLNEQ
jgi:response regulator RpfG family c-di-GMP phosphodiesterase